MPAATMPIAPRPATGSQRLANPAAPPPLPTAPVIPSGWLYLLLGAGIVLVAADTRAFPFVAAVLTAAIIYQLGQIAG